MKKLLLLAVCLGSAATMFAQGTIDFRNTASTNFRLWTNGPVGGASNLLSGANAYRVGLYGSTDLGAAESSLGLLLLTTNASQAALAGYFNGGSAAAVPGVAAGSQIRFQLRVWSLFAGANHTEARTAQLADPLNVAIGVSSLGTATLGGGTVLPGQVFGTNPGALSRGFEVAPVPEPSSIALGLLGIGAIALFRRRK